MTDPWLSQSKEDFKSDYDRLKYYDEAYQEPHKFPSIMRLMYNSGQRKFQRLFTKLIDMSRFNRFFEGIPALIDKARFRGILHSLSTLPFYVVPNTKTRELANSEFQWLVANRLNISQPSSESLGPLKCTCGKDLDGGRHFRRCKVGGGMMKVHDSVRDTMHKMLKSSGLLTRKEPKYLLRDNANDRPADNFVEDWTLPRIPFVRHAIDWTLPLVDSAFNQLPKEQKLARASTVGVLAKRATQDKRDDVGTEMEQSLRGNAFTMQTRTRLERINFMPVGVEGDGVPSEEFEDLIKKVSKTASELRGHNRISFGNKWRVEIAMTIAKTSAKVSLARCLATKVLRRRAPPLDDICGEPQLDVPIAMDSRRAFRNSYSDRMVKGSQ